MIDKKTRKKAKKQIKKSRKGLRKAGKKIAKEKPEKSALKVLKTLANEIQAIKLLTPFALR